VIIGSNSVAPISSVNDAAGNSYQLAIGPSGNGSISQSIYYAKNIKLPASGLNTVSVVFSSPPAYPDIRILEYSGIDPVNAIDTATGASEPTMVTASGVINTTNPLDLLVAGNYVQWITTGPGANFTQRILTSDDDIAEDRVVTAPGFYSATAPLKDSGEGSWVMQLVAFRAAGVSSPDTIPPTATITVPVAGASLTGTTTVTVTASDIGSGVAAVQLQVDGVPFGTADTTSPYTFSLNTAKFANGPHTLTASAWDFANNVGNSSSIAVNFTSSGNPAQTGLWSGTVPLPIVSVNSILLPSGKILMYDGQTEGFSAIVWNPITNTIEWAPVPVNIFCSGMEQLSDGRILVAGGHVAADTGLPAATIFNPNTETWTVGANMAWGRWYPTATSLSDGRILVNSGETNCDECDETIPEIYTPSTDSWTQLNSAPFFFPYYPHVFLLPDGRVFVPSDCEAPIVSQVFNLNTLTWTSIGGPAVDGGSCVMYLPSKFLKLGTSTDPDLTIRTSVTTAYVLDMTQTSPTWVQVASMAFPRTYQNATSLPDGTVLVTGGGPTTNAVGVASGILQAELWSPTTQTFTTLASMSAPRLYHSEGLLLPDGRVLVSGGGRFNNVTETTDQETAEFFSPPYLFKGARPSIAGAPTTLVYGQSFTVQTPDAARIATVSLIRFGSVTHASNMSQRYLPLTFTVGAGALTITAPANSNLAPPGNYMLFIVDSNGIPSVASVVHF
jgi:Domain of unknown function (DUF1929)/Bacterial Ig domain